MRKLLNWIKAKIFKPKWENLHIPIIQTPRKPSGFTAPPTFHGNSHQRRVARRAWERDQRQKYLDQTRDAGLNGHEEMVD